MGSFFLCFHVQFRLSVAAMRNKTVISLCFHDHFCLSVKAARNKIVMAETEKSHVAD